MSAGLARETWSERRGSHDFEGRRDYTRGFRVRTTSDSDGVTVVGAALGVPRLGDPYFDAAGNSDTAARCIRVEPHHDQDDPRTWIVICEYTTEFGSSGGSSTSFPTPDGTVIENPLLRPARFSGGFRLIEKVMERELNSDGVENGREIANSAGDKFANQPTRPEKTIQFSVKRNLAELPLLTVAPYIQCFNTSSFAGFPARTVLFDDLKFSDNRENGVYFWECEFLFVYNPDEWEFISLLDYGANYIVSGAKAAIKDARSGENIEDFLNGAGGRLGAGAAKVYLNFRRHAGKNLNDLGIL